MAPEVDVEDPAAGVLEETFPSSWVDHEGWIWVRACDVVPGKSWKTLGVLSFPDLPVREHVAVIGAGTSDLDLVLLWCPAVRSGWLSLKAFVEATRGVSFTGFSPVWARNLSEDPVEIDVRFRFSSVGEAPMGAPDVTPGYYGSAVWKRTTWLGVPVLKCPLDLWVMQEILSEVRPSLVIETGTFMGGSALHCATVMDALGVGRVVTVDVERREPLPSHPRIQWVQGSSVEGTVVDLMKTAASRAGGHVVVVLDSDHSYTHVLAELRAYAPLVTPGSCLVVEDTNTPGPFEALAAFLASPEGSSFDVDRTREKFGTGFNPGGWLRKRGDAK